LNSEKRPYITTVELALDELSKVRKEKGAWLDKESLPEGQSNDFKIAEALYAFLVANKLQPATFSRIILPKSTIYADIKKILSAIEKDEFFPSPYSNETSPKVHQAIDFAAFATNFSIEMREWLKKEKNPDQETNRLIKSLEELTSKTAGFIISSAAQDGSRFRWAGTPTYEVPKGKHTNVFFTSVAMEALYNCCLLSPKSLEDVDKVKKMVNLAGYWIIERQKNGLIAGDERKTIFELQYSTYGLTGIFKTWDLQSESVKEESIKIFERYLNELPNNMDEINEEKYFSLVSKDRQGVDATSPFYYESKHTEGSVLIALCWGRKVGGMRVATEKYYNTLNLFINDILQRRDPNRNTWERTGLIISTTLSAIEALLLCTEFGKPMEFTFTDSDVQEALKRTMQDDAFYRMVIDNLKAIEQEKQIKKLKGETNT
jgi:hypothetical protein